MTEKEQRASIHESLESQKIRDKAVYPEKEVAAMSDEEKAELHALNVKESIEDARRGKFPKRPGTQAAAKSVAPTALAADRVSPLPDPTKLNSSTDKSTDQAKHLAEALDGNKKSTDTLIKQQDKISKESKKEIANQIKAFKLLTKNFDLLLGATKVPDNKKTTIFSQKGFLEKIGIGNSSLVGGMLHKLAETGDERSEFVKIGKMRTPKATTGQLKERYGKMKAEQKVLAKAVAERNKMVEGGMSDKDISRYSISQDSKKGFFGQVGKGGVESRIAASENKLKKWTPGAKEQIEKNNTFYGADDFEETQPRRKEVAASVVAPKNSAANQEALDDQNKMIEEQTKLLKDIRDNTDNTVRQRLRSADDKSKKGGEGFLDGIMGFFGGGMANALKSLFSPKMLLSALTKIALPALLIGAIFSGVSDAIDEYKKSGSFAEAVVAFGAGILKLLTFGLLDKESIKKLADVISDKMLVFTNAVGDMFSSIGDWFGDLKDKFLNIISNIGIPEIKLGSIKGFDLGSIGPFYPFKGLTNATATPQAPVTSPRGIAPTNRGIADTPPKQVAPRAADIITSKSEENAGMKTEQAAPSTTTVVSAPTTNNKTSIVQVKRPERTTERSSNQLLASVY